MTEALKDTPEEKNEIYKQAFDYVCRNKQIDDAILNSIISLENRYPLRGDPHYDNQVLDILFQEKTFQICLETAVDKKTEQDKTFKELKGKIVADKFIIDQINDLKRNRGIAIIGNNYGLTSGIVNYLWLTTPLLYTGTPPIWLLMSPIRQKFFDAVGNYIDGKIGFAYVNCDGVNDGELHKLLFSDLGIVPNLQGSMFFLRSINNNHSSIIKRLLGVMKDANGSGNLVISTDNLPKELESQFEVINLETKKQDIPDTPEPKGKMGFQKP